jgi:hypothetical protein
MPWYAVSVDITLRVMIFSVFGPPHHAERDVYDNPWFILKNLGAKWTPARLSSSTEGNK